MSNSAKKLGAHQIRPLSQQVKKNYTNQKFHSAVDLAKFYSGLVDTHFQFSKAENHVLSSVNRSYKYPQPIKSKSLTTFKTNTRKVEGSEQKAVKLTNKKLSGLNPEMNQNQSQSIIFEQKSDILDKAEFNLLKRALSKRATRVPEYSESLRQKCEQKKHLDEYIAELRRLITQQKKMKTKISLNCNKIMNQREILHANTCKKAEQNYHLSVKIAKQEQACADISEENQQLRRKLARTRQNIRQETQLRNKLKEYVEKSRIILRNQQRDVAQMKEWTSAAYNNMGNNFQYMNQLKEGKALLLAEVDTNYNVHG